MTNSVLSAVLQELRTKATANAPTTALRAFISSAKQSQAMGATSHGANALIRGAPRGLEPGTH